MKKITTLIAVAVLIAFGLIFAATNYPNSPPVMAESVTADVIGMQTDAPTLEVFDFTENLQTAVDSGFDTAQSGNFATIPKPAAYSGDIPINAMRNKDYSNTRRIRLNFSTEEPKITKANFTFADFKYKSPPVSFRGFGIDAQARSKIWS